MNILVINAGSSSMKYQLINMTDESVVAKGNCERIGMDGLIGHKTADGKKVEYNVDFPTHAEAFKEIIKVLTTGDAKVIDSVSEIAAVGHRAVHGGDKFASSVLLTEDVMNAIDELSDLAPLHNPPGLAAIKACKAVFGDDVPMAAVFDTAFHQTMPSKAYVYPIPYSYYEDYRVRRYGFHGTSHRFVSNRLAELMGKPVTELKIVTCHLGNGSSISAVDCGKSVDTTMGLTPLEGMIMGTRSGTIDPSIINYICQKENKTVAEVSNILNKKSGLLGVSGASSDQRDLHAAIEGGNERAKLAVDIQMYQVKKYIGAFAAAMGGLDAVVFTGGIGENDEAVRQGACENMEFLGLNFSKERNDAGSRKEALISTDDSRVQAWVVPTNEELLIARDTLAIVNSLKK